MSTFVLATVREGNLKVKIEQKHSLQPSTASVASSSTEEANTSNEHHKGEHKKSSSGNLQSFINQINRRSRSFSVKTAEVFQKMKSFSNRVAVLRNNGELLVYKQVEKNRKFKFSLSLLAISEDSLSICDDTTFKLETAECTYFFKCADEDETQKWTKAILKELRKSKQRRGSVIRTSSLDVSGSSPRSPPTPTPEAATFSPTSSSPSPLVHTPIITTLPPPEGISVPEQPPATETKPTAPGDQSAMERLTLLAPAFATTDSKSYGAVGDMVLLANTVQTSSAVEINFLLVSKISGGHAIVKQGYLLKEGPNNKPWRRRYFVLNENQEMRYFSQMGGEPKGLFSIKNSLISRPTKKRSHDFVFEIETLSRTFVLAAESYEILKSWMMACGQNGGKIKLDENDGIITADFLNKETKTQKIWKKQYFVLYETKQLKYFSKQGGSQKGQIDLEGCVVSVAPEKGREFCFKVYTPERTYYIQAESDTKMREWMFNIVKMGGTLKKEEEPEPVFKQISDIEQEQEEKELQAKEHQRIELKKLKVEKPPIQKEAPKPEKTEPASPQTTKPAEAKSVESESPLMSPSEKMRARMLEKKSRKSVAKVNIDVEKTATSVSSTTTTPLSTISATSYSSSVSELSSSAENYSMKGAPSNTSFTSTLSRTSYNSANVPIVVDNGSGTLKVGYAGNERPDVMFPCIIGKPKHEQVLSSSNASELYLGDKADKYRGVLALEYPIKRGAIQNYDHMELLWSYAFDKIRATDLEKHPMLFTESVSATKASREKQAMLLFETYGAPAMYLSQQSVLSMYACGLTTGLVVDMGDGITTVTPIYEGYSLSHATHKLKVAGHDLTQYLSQLLLQSQSQVFKSTTAEMEIIKQIKEECCYIRPDLQTVASLEKREYRLPDGTVILLGEELHSSPESLFDPSLLGVESDGIHTLCFKSVMQCDIDLRQSLAGNIVLAGGTSLLKGLQDRMQRELDKLKPNSSIKVKVGAFDNREIFPWIGGSIMSSLSSFKDMWISRQEYEEYGLDIVRKKCI